MSSYGADASHNRLSRYNMSSQPQHELFGALRQLYRASEYSDLTLVTRDGNKIPVHRAIVCPRSAFLAQAVKGKRWHDSCEGEVSMTDDDPELIALLIEYLYLLDYVPPPAPPSSDSSSRIRDQDSDTISVRTDPIHFGHVYGTSAVSAFGGPRDNMSGQSPYNMPFGHNRERAESQLTVHALPGATDFTALSRAEGHRRMSGRSMTAPPDPSPLATKEPNLVLHAGVYAAGERYGITGLKALALDKFKIQLTRHWDSSEFPEAIHVAYNSTSSSDKDMRESVANTIGWHGRLLDKPEVEVAIMEINGLAYELLKRARRVEPEY